MATETESIKIKNELFLLSYFIEAKSNVFQCVFCTKTKSWSLKKIKSLKGLLNLVFFWLRNTDGCVYKELIYLNETQHYLRMWFCDFEKELDSKHNLLSMYLSTITKALLPCMMQLAKVIMVSNLPDDLCLSTFLSFQHLLFVENWKSRNNPVKPLVSH